MKMLLVVLMLTLIGCASKQEQPTPRAYDTQWSDFNGDVMLECGKVAGKMAEGDDSLAEAIYNQCLIQMGATI